MSTDAELAELLRSTRTIAVVGASADPRRPSHEVSAYLLARTAYEVWFVNPKGGEILGHPVLAGLDDLPAAPDMVDVFRRSEDCEGVARDAVRVGARSLWLQLGVRNDAAARIAADAGLAVVMDRCIKVDHARLLGPYG